MIQKRASSIIIPKFAKINLRVLNPKILNLKYLIMRLLETKTRPIAKVKFALDALLKNQTENTHFTG